MKLYYAYIVGTCKVVSKPCRILQYLIIIFVILMILINAYQFTAINWYPFHFNSNYFDINSKTFPIAD